MVERMMTNEKEPNDGALETLMDAAKGLVSMQMFQRMYVDYALVRFGGNKVHTAAALGIDRRTIQRWTKERMMKPSTPRDEGASEGHVRVTEEPSEDTMIPLGNQKPEGTRDEEPAYASDSST
jgi:hypothetical protein